MSQAEDWEGGEGHGERVCQAESSMSKGTEAAKSSAFDKCFSFVRGQCS